MIKPRNSAASRFFEADLGPDLARMQIKVLRNLAGMMAQKASDIRRDLYLETVGADMYGPEYLIER